VGETVTDTLQAVVNTEPPSPRLLNPSVPPDLETLCLKCLQKEPGRRYPTALALAEEMGRFLRNETIQARPVRRREKLWRWCRRKPALAGLIGGLAVALFAGFSAVLWQSTARQNALAETRRLRVIGYNWKDEPADALRWLEQFGNPYWLVLSDVEGSSAIDWGIYGAPETFLVDRGGIVRWKHVGALTDAIIARELMPALQEAEGSK
jgi:hypothetical protein